MIKRKHPSLGTLVPLLTILVICYSIVFRIIHHLKHLIIFKHSLSLKPEIKVNKRSQIPRRLLSKLNDDNSIERKLIDKIPSMTVTLENEKKVHNFFNCKKEENHQPLCTHVNIKEFFESTNGLGYNYRELAFKYARRTIYRDLRFYHINCTSTSVIDDIYMNNHHLFDSIPSNLNYIHIHKNGGTTIRHAFYNLRHIAAFDTGNSISCDTKIYNSKEMLHGKIRITRPQLVQNVSNFVNEIIAKQAMQDGNDNVVLSFIRDPVVRFLSQVGETIRQGVKHPMGHPGPVFGCRDKNIAKEAIQCIIDEIKVNGTIVDKHYTPAAIELYLADSRRSVGSKGVNINLYDMKYLGLFLNRLRYTSSHVKMRSATSKEYNEYFNFAIDDLSNEMIQDICKIYEMDVILLNSIGLTSSFCEIS